MTLPLAVRGLDVKPLRSFDIAVQKAGDFEAGEALTGFSYE